MMMGAEGTEQSTIQHFVTHQIDHGPADPADPPRENPETTSPRSRDDRDRRHPRGSKTHRASDIGDAVGHTYFRRPTYGDDRVSRRFESLDVVDHQSMVPICDEQDFADHIHAVRAVARGHGTQHRCRLVVDKTQDPHVLVRVQDVELVADDLETARRHLVIKGLDPMHVVRVLDTVLGDTASGSRHQQQRDKRQTPLRTHDIPDHVDNRRSTPAAKATSNGPRQTVDYIVSNSSWLS